MTPRLPSRLLISAALAACLVGPAGASRVPGLLRGREVRPVPGLPPPGPLSAQPWSFRSLLDLVEAVGSPLPVPLFDRIAAAAGLPAFSDGDRPPYGKLNTAAPGLQKAVIVRRRADDTLDVIVQSNPHGAPTLSYVVDEEGLFVSGTSALRGEVRPMTGEEAAKLPEELAYWRHWQEEANRAALVGDGSPAQPGR